ncbi:EAL domain-containing protein [Hydrogenoanaerobacterium sp.]|uniref:bifunctional diguanylate cyclase/phosphodiesterase n=1 Tax=Hydrogenoanaerobacterium sp. TaxID=2953763 RepID=UPI00289EB035|nr:EAL domain-containing protein [Hydrogenoanaerobacterium sp.]
MNKTEQRKRDNYMIFASILGVVFILFVMLTLYLNLSRTILKLETERSLSDISELISVTVADRINHSLRNLELAATTCAMLDDPAQIVSYLQETSESQGSARLSYIDRNGLCYTTDGRQVDVSGGPVFVRIFGGEKQVVAHIPKSNIDGTEVIVYAVPVKKDGKLTGALVASSPPQNVGERLAVQRFDGEGVSYIVNHNGDGIIISQNRSLPSNFTNFFEMMADGGKYDSDRSAEKMQQDMRKGKDGIMYFRLKDDVHKVMFYTPLNVEDWYLLSVVPTSYTQHNTVTILRFGVWISISIMILFLILIAMIVWNSRKNREQLEHAAFVDPITKGYTCIKFETEAISKIKNAPAGTYALLSLDIYKFKIINDRGGCEAGNKTLKYLHDIVYRHLSEGEMIARISADVFNILIFSKPQEEIVKRLDAIVTELNAYNEQLEIRYYLQVQAGIYTIDNPNLEFITIQDRANIARKIAKKTESIQLLKYSFYEDMIRVQQNRETEMENCMEQALENGEFCIYLQPKINIQTNTVGGAEALVRWNDPQKGMIPPNEFIPLFERNGFIIKLDLYVFEQVCRLIRKWIDAGVEPIPISINLSRVHLRDPQFLEPYKLVHEKYDIPAKLLEFEITETVLFENMKNLTNVIDRIHEAGFWCSLDDFGSGYSSLNLLNEFPVDIIKLDGAFQKSNTQGNTRGKKIIQSILSLAKELNMQTVSEGVETISQVEFLRSANCDMVQGYVFSKPVPVDEFECFVWSDHPGSSSKT